MIFIAPLLLPIIGFILQSYPRFFNKSFGVDVWTRLLEIDAFRDSNHKIPGKIQKGFIIEGHFDYPPVFPFIFSFLSRKTIIKYQGYISPLIDSFQTLLVFIICYHITGNLGMSLLAQLIYIVIPMIAVENSYLTPRSLGYLIFTTSFYPLLVFQITQNNFALVVSIASGTLLYLTHRFALQSYIFICLFMLAFTASLHFLLVPMLCFTLAIILTRGYYLRVAKGHLSNVYFWVINYKYRFAHQVYGLTNKKKADWVGVIYMLLSELSPIFLLITNVWASFAFVYLFIFSTQTSFYTHTIFIYFALWIAFFYILGVIVLRFKFLIPIGEGQRYLEMATVPTAIISSFTLFYLHELYGTPIIMLGTVLIAGNLAMILFIQIKGVIKDKNRSLTPELERMYAYINKLPGRPQIMCIPHQITTMTVFHTKADVLVNADNPGLMKLSDFFPILNTDINTLKKKYHLDYILLRENFAREEDLRLTSKKIAYSSGDIKLIKI